MVSPQLAAGEGGALAKKPRKVPGESPGNSAKVSTQPLAGKTPASVSSMNQSAAQFALDQLNSGSWHQLLEILGLTGIVYNIASHCEMRSRIGDVLEFVLDGAHAALYNDSHSDKLRLALGNYFGHPVLVSVVPGEPQGETPAMRQARLAEQRQAEAIVAIEGDPQLQALIARFDGELDHSSILPTDT
jgi:DNA polymerase-3 subunit gamma/tau